MSPQGLNPQSRGKVSTILGSTHPTTKPAYVLGIRVLNLKAVWCVITVKKSVLFDGDLKFIFVVWKKSFGAEHNCSLCHRSNDILQINVCFSQHKCLTNYANKCIRFVTISHSYWHFIVFHFILGFFLMQFLPIFGLINTFGHFNYPLFNYYICNPAYIYKGISKFWHLWWIDNWNIY